MFYVRQTRKTHSSNFSVRGYVPIISKDSVTHMHDVTVYAKELQVPFAWDLSLKNSEDSYISFRMALLHLFSNFFFLCRWLSYLCTVSNAMSFNIDEVLSINPSANIFVFLDFNIHRKDWLTYSGGIARLGELCYNFSISEYLTQMVNFLPGSLTVTLTLLLFWIYFFLQILVFVAQ